MMLLHAVAGEARRREPQQCIDGHAGEERTMATERQRANAQDWVAHGLIGGIGAGMMMAMAAMIWMWSTGDGFFQPLNIIASSIMGEGVVTGQFQIAPAIIGAMIHLVLSAVFGLLFSWLIAKTALPSGAIVAAGIAFGLALWVINVVVIDATFIPAGFDVMPLTLQVVSHVVYGFFIGLVTAPRFTQVN
jgi:hypothetical protein